MDVILKNSQPQMFGYYSITSDREYDPTPSSLRYFKKPLNLPLDLNIGIDSIKAKPDSYFEEKMDSILTYIVRNRAELMSADGDQDMRNALIPSTKYVTYRGIIRKIMCSPYEKRSGWCILATKYKNNIYLSQLTRPEERDASQNAFLKRLCYYGPKFEQYCLTDDPSKNPDPSEQIDACTQFFGVFKRMLLGRCFLFAGEMDGVVSDKPVNLNESQNLNNLRFIELKVTPDPSSSKSAPKNFKNSKSLNVWTQSFLTGVEDVYFGMRDVKGIIQKIEHYSTKELLRLGLGYWDPSKCFKFLENFLKLVEAKTDKINCPKTVFEFNLDTETLDITCTKHPGETELSLLPDWYIEQMTSIPTLKK